ncbi:MAG TPA: substrate-binding domain-containing protein [Solirubrobacteraceae bacterium]|nr:substrate-binding domain-containing protein [Solirubrobacteraceae bacterium]
MSEATRRLGRRSRRARIAASVATVSTAAVLIASGSSASAHTARASASLLPATVHPPTFNDAKLFGIRNALYNAMKGKSVKSVNTWMVVNILATYWVAGKDGNAAAAKELGVAAHFEGPSQGQLSTQVSEYNTLAASGANGMFTSVIDPVSEGATINKAESKGVNVVAIDSPVPAKNAKTFVYVGTPNTAAGEAAGAAMKKALPGGGDVAILEGSSTATNSLQRIAGFKAALKGSKITVSTIQNDNGSAATAASNADSVIAGNPNLKGIYGVYSYDGPAAAVAVKAKGDTGKIHVIADDTEPGTITGLKNGTVSASIIQQPFMQGYLGTYITAAMKVLGSAKTASLIKPFETAGQISTGVGTLTKANLAADVSYNKTISGF